MSDLYPGASRFPQAVAVIGQYMSELADAKISSIRDAHVQTDLPLTGQTVIESISALRTSLEEVISARRISWQGYLRLLQGRPEDVAGGSESAMVEAIHDLEQQASRLCEKAESKLDVMLQSDLAARERNKTTEVKSPKMPRMAAVLRILIASPSDVLEERRRLTEVVHDWNATNSAATGIVLQPVKWETHAYPASGDRPQGIINKQIVDDCDIVIGVFWSRLGTATGMAPSGTAEEIERLRAGGRMFFFTFLPRRCPKTTIEINGTC